MYISCNREDPWKPAVFAASIIDLIGMILTKNIRAGNNLTFSLSCVINID